MLFNENKFIFLFDKLIFIYWLFSPTFYNIFIRSLLTTVTTRTGNSQTKYKRTKIHCPPISHTHTNQSPSRGRMEDLR